MALFLVHSERLITPSTRTLDLNAYAAAVANGAGPYVLGFQYWLDVADAGSPAGFGIDFNWVDPSTGTRQIPGTPFGLAALPGYFASPLQMVARLSSSSQFELQLTLSGGAAGAAKVSFDIFHLPVSSTDLLGW